MTAPKTKKKQVRNAERVMRHREQLESAGGGEEASGGSDETGIEFGSFGLTRDYRVGEEMNSGHGSTDSAQWSLTYDGDTVYRVYMRESAVGDGDNGWVKQVELEGPHLVISAIDGDVALIELAALKRAADVIDVIAEMLCIDVSMYRCKNRNVLYRCNDLMTEMLCINAPIE